MTQNAPMLTLCLEQTLGHRAHGQNLEQGIRGRELSSTVVRVNPPELRHMRLPWALLGSAMAWSALRRRRTGGLVLFHTQTIALFAPVLPGGHRYVVSVDATPIQVDSMGRHYNHRRGPRLIEQLKLRWYRRVLADARAVIAWSEWAARSLTSDYGVPPERIVVAHPGAPAELFAIERAEGETPGVRILFVGGNFERKGGPQLLAAFRAIRSEGLELVLVTESDVPPEAGVRVERGVRPGTPRLIDEYRRADIFCLPTLGDCTPIAVEEAMAAGLPVVTTTVGANTETVVNGETGLLVPAGDVQALASALRTLVDDPERRASMGSKGRQRALEMLHAGENAQRIIDLMVALA